MLISRLQRELRSSPSLSVSYPYKFHIWKVEEVVQAFVLAGGGFKLRSSPTLKIDFH
jgi:hypothetical protein